MILVLVEAEKNTKSVAEKTHKIKIYKTNSPAL